MNTGLAGYCNKGIPVLRVLCQSYRSHRSSGLGYGDLTELTEFRVRVRKCYRTHRSSGYCGTGIQNSQKFRAGIKMLYPYPRVFMALAYRTYRSSGYGYGCPTELTEVLCRVIPAVNTSGMVLYVPYRTQR